MTRPRLTTPPTEDPAPLRRTPTYRRTVWLLRSSVLAVLGGFAAAGVALALGSPTAQLFVFGGPAVGLVLALLAGVARRRLARRVVGSEVALNELLFADVFLRGRKP